MTALKAIGWFVLTVIAVGGIFETIGWNGLVRMFPEGRRWWMLPLQLFSLASFAALVHWNPF
jgi:hypothetical protein